MQNKLVYFDVEIDNMIGKLIANNPQAWAWINLTKKSKTDDFRYWENEGRKLKKE